MSYMTKVFLKTNAQGKLVIRTKTREGPHQNAWMLQHMIAQIARFGLLNLEIRGREDNPIMLAKSLGKDIAKEIKDELIRKKGPSLFFWPFEQSLSIVHIAFVAKSYAIIKADIQDFQQRRILEEFCKAFAKEANIGIVAYTIDTGRFSQKAKKGMMHNAHHQFEGLGKALGRALRNLTESKTYLLPAAARQEFKRMSLETTIRSAWEFRGTGKVKINIEAKRDPDRVIEVLQKGLEKFGAGGRFNLYIKALGDDEHHVYEDLAIVLGNLFNQLLGERRGIVRTAWSLRAFEGGLALVAADLGRGYCHIETDIKNQALQSMTHHFFESFSRFGKLDIVAFGIGKKHPFMKHIKSFLPFILSRSELKKIRTGALQDRLLVRALFEVLGISIKEAVKIDHARIQEIPSTKGLID